MKFITNEMESLTEASTLKAFRLKKGEFFNHEGVINIEFKGMLFRVDDECSGMFSYWEENSEKQYSIFEIPGKNHPLYLLWHLYLNDITEENEGFVYLIKCQDRYKIGQTSDLRSRMSSYHTHSPYEPELIASRKVGGFQKSESEIHKFFKDYRKHGEWFTLPKAHINLLKRFLGWNNIGGSFEFEQKLWTDPRSENLQYKLMITNE